LRLLSNVRVELVVEPVFELVEQVNRLERQFTW